MSRSARIATTVWKIMCRVIGGLLLLSAILVVSLFLVCRFQPELVSTIVSHQLKQYTGLLWELNDLRPSLLPPGVRFGHIHVYEDNDTEIPGETVFSAKELILEPNVVKLILGGRIEFRSVVLDTPVFRLNPTLFLQGDERERTDDDDFLLNQAGEQGSIFSSHAPLPHHPDASLLRQATAVRGMKTQEKSSFENPFMAEIAGAIDLLVGTAFASTLEGKDGSSDEEKAGGNGADFAIESLPVTHDASTVTNQTSMQAEEEPDPFLWKNVEPFYGPPVPRRLRAEQLKQLRATQGAVMAHHVLSGRERLARELGKELRYFRRKLHRDWRSRLWNLRIINGDFTQRDAEGNVVLGVHDINVDASLNPWHTSVVRSRLALPADGLSLDSTVTFVLPSRFSKTYMQGTVDVDVALQLPDERPITGSLSLAGQWERKNNHMRITSLILEAEGDKAEASIDFDPHSLTAVGQLVITQLSLPRWFYFARNLPPGLQEALHHISGTVNFSTDLLGIAGSELVANAGNLSLTGSLGVERFSDPVVKVEVAMEEADADALFPFLATASHPAPEPVEPQFDMPYLAPFPGPGGEDAPDVWYDVRVEAHKSRVHAIAAQNLVVTVLPVGETLTRVDIDCKEVGRGSLVGRLDIDKTLTMMYFDVKGLDLSLLPENIDSSVTFGGRLTGKTTLTIDVKNTKWADIWGIEFTGGITDQSIHLTGKDGWTLFARDVGVSGKGKVNTVKAKGLTLTGDWKAVTKGVHSSWHKQGNDAVTYTLNGSFAWPNAAESKQYSGIRRISGDMVAEGVIHLPLGTQIVPVKGVLRSPMEWDIPKDLLRLPQYSFKGMESVSSGSMQLDASQKGTVFTASQRFTLAPRTVLAAWNLLPEAIQMPKLMTGTTDFKATADVATFSRLRFDADGAITTGTVAIHQPRGKQNNIVWDIDLHAKRINLDNYFPPATAEEKRNPSTVPWALEFLDGMDIKGSFVADHASFQDIAFNQFQAAGSLKSKALNVMIMSPDVYGGRTTCQVQGHIEPKRSTVTLSRGNLVMKGINLAAAFADQGKGLDYGGKADIVFDVSGTMRCTADFPAALSGPWSLEIRDGLYPAFMGSKSAGLRNTFSRAASSGKVTKGVLETSNFILGGSMVDMKGGGKLDLVKRVVDMKASVTVAGMPTFPVEVQGAFETFSINVGGNFITGTAHVAGSTVFNIFMGILELPGKAISGVNSLLTTKNKVEKKEYTPYRQSP